MLTTNDPDALDPAVARPGRIDLRENFALAGPEQVSRLVAHYYGELAAAVQLPAQGIPAVAPAEVIEACKRNDAPQTALRDLRELAFSNAA